MPSGADLEYARMLARSGQTSGVGMDGARLEQLNDEAFGVDNEVGAKISTPGSASRDAVDEVVNTSVATSETRIIKEQRKFTSGLYLPTEHSLLRWRASRSRTLAGTRQGHIAVLGDSIPYGAGEGAVQSPKYLNNWVGLLREASDRRYGQAGSGLVFAEANKFTNPAWDPRWTYGSTVVNHAFGLFKAGSFRIDAVAGQFIEFTDEADTFVVYNYGNAGLNTAQVDGVTVGTFRNQGGTGGAASSIPKELEYWTSQVVTNIPAGAFGTHTLKIIPDTASAGNDTFVAAIEAKRSVVGTFKVTEACRSGMSFLDLFSRVNYNDEVNGLYGLPMIDMIRADLLIIALGINDWNGGRSLASTKADLKTTIQRQRQTSASTATVGKGVAGDVLLLWNPSPNLETLGLTATASWDEFRSMFYDVADEENCALLDLGDRWGGYTNGNNIGLFADGIHPNNAGSRDIAPAVERVIFDYS